MVYIVHERTVFLDPLQQLLQRVIMQVGELGLGEDKVVLREIEVRDGQYDVFSHSVVNSLLWVLRALRPAVQRVTMNGPERVGDAYSAVNDLPDLVKV